MCQRFLLDTVCIKYTIGYCMAGSLMLLAPPLHLFYNIYMLGKRSATKTNPNV